MTPDSTAYEIFCRDLRTPGYVLDLFLSNRLKS